jgi:hypothetical protein
LLVLTTSWEDNMTWIEPLAMQDWFINVLSGKTDIFLGLALMVITSLSAYFRMNGMAMFLMLAIFMLLMNPFIDSALTLVIFIFLGLGIGYWIAKTVN